MRHELFKIFDTENKCVAIMKDLKQASQLLNECKSFVRLEKFIIREELPEFERKLMRGEINV